MLKKRIWHAALCLGFSIPLSAGTPQAVAQAVLDRLYAANGNYQFKKPGLVISPENKKVAAYSPWKNVIVLDEKTYRICQSYGRDSLSALAYILGHELVHAYQAQIKGQRLKTNFLAYDQGYNADIRTEKVADIQGVFNAYLAGYGVLKTMPAVIDKIYAEYGLKGKNLSSYPALEERKATCREVLDIAQNLCDIYESCNYLLAIGQTGLACSGYEYILRYYQGREIYNNLGVAYTLSAQQFWNPHLDKYIYPVEADWYTKLSHIANARGQEPPGPSVEPLRLAFLDKAVENFAAAARLDPGYLTARINTLCALNMKGSPVEALKYAEINLLKYTQGKKRRAGQEAEMIEIAIGITYALQPGNTRQNEAHAIFSRLSGSSYVLSALYARQNRQSLRGETESRILTEIPLPESIRKVTGQISLSRTDDMEPIPLDEKTGVAFAQKSGPGSVTTVFSNQNGNLVSLLRFPNRLAPDVTILPPQEDLEHSAYRNIVVAKDGFYLKSPRDKVVLKVDARGRVLEMVKYIEHEL